ncbi:molybdopterin-binding protein [Calderihabitans maritimus]|uniref:Molybdopterin binding domain-containing protein n=1 Tax=Calderihabitans maritimus TaxID=1246530 RepID=A0A1Z5HNJ7_9FIRM|nr:molybdopterin-binding protein [Calderihabitans maritimus]GAW91028.1 molybdopterin binding domain-containing protein [Calderihabitans maritimus]
MNWNLLEKTTFWIEGVQLEKADLGLIAREAAAVLGLAPHEVLVVDVRPNLIAFDILRREVPAEAVAGKGEELMERLRRIPGVTMNSPEIHSEGVLGLIALDPGEARDVLRASSELANRVADTVSKRALVFASGSEVLAGNIKDTNSPYLIAALKQAGYKAEYGGILPDDADASAARLEDALGKGYGLIVTTGGVGAEDKDFTVEAVLRLDPEASTPYILNFTPDGLRHHKDGVRIAVGEVGVTKLIALPGPHDEVKLACEYLLEGLRKGLSKDSLAQVIASALRERWQKFMHGGGETIGCTRTSLKVT